MHQTQIHFTQKGFHNYLRNKKWQAVLLSIVIQSVIDQSN